MRILEKTLTAVLFYFFLFIAPSTEHIIPLKLQFDKRHKIPYTDFEFSNVGYISFAISSVTVTSTSSSSSRPDPSRIGFILQPHELVRNKTRSLGIQQNNTICALDFKLNSVVLFTFENLSHDPFNKSCPVTSSGMNSLFFVNCNNESSVTMDGRAELYNIDDSTTKNYLSLGLTQLPFLSFLFSFIYLSFLGFWILICFNKTRPFNRIHLVMGGLLVMNSVYLICVAADLLYVKARGTAHGLDVLFYIFELSRAVFLSTVIVLVGVGWCLWQPILEGEEKTVLIIVTLLQVCANVDPVLPWEAAVPYNKEGLSMSEIICCFVSFFPMVGSVLLLLKTCETDLNADRNLGKLCLFMKLVVVYMLITKGVVLDLSTRWVNFVVKETGILVFQIMMFYIFRPVDRKRIKNEESWLSTSMSNSCFHSLV